jgi:hypothetical protein
MEAACRVTAADEEVTRVFKREEEADVVDDDDEDEEFVEPFSLLENVLKERFEDPAEVEGYVAAEVIRYHGREIADLQRADPGHKVRIDPDGFQLLRVGRSGRATLFFRSSFSGAVVMRGRARPLGSLCRERFRVPGSADLYAISVCSGDYAQVVRGGVGYLVRFVRPPVQPPPARRFSWPSLAQAQMLAGSAALHLMVLVLLGFTGAEADLTIGAVDRETFAPPGTYKLPLEKPKPDQRPAPEPTTPPEVKAPAVRRPGRNVLPPLKRARRQRERQVRRVLSALENLRPASAGPGRANLKSLVQSSISVVRAPAGTLGFRLAGVVNKAGGQVRMAGGGAGDGKETRTGSQLLGSGTIGRLVAVAGTGRRGPRGRVRRAPRRRIVCDGGYLDKAAIQRVVNQHMHEVQQCYEVQLLRNPSLQGKVVLDWVIAPSGRVRTARQLSSTLASPAVASCVLGRIRSWAFPRPVGGSITVRYPFVFRVKGF